MTTLKIKGYQGRDHWLHVYDDKVVLEYKYGEKVMFKFEFGRLFMHNEYLFTDKNMKIADLCKITKTTTLFQDRLTTLTAESEYNPYDNYYYVSLKIRWYKTDLFEIVYIIKQGKLQNMHLRIPQKMLPIRLFGCDRDERFATTYIYLSTLNEFYGTNFTELFYRYLDKDKETLL